MICRRSKDDPSCSSRKDYVDTYSPTAHTKQSLGSANSKSRGNMRHTGPEHGGPDDR